VSFRQDLAAQHCVVVQRAAVEFCRIEGRLVTVVSDNTGVIAFGSTAIGWQVAASDFSGVQAFVVCAGS
jgi:hypothetical protein